MSLNVHSIVYFIVSAIPALFPKGSTITIALSLLYEVLQITVLRVATWEVNVLCYVFGRPLGVHWETFGHRRYANESSNE